MRSRKKLYAWLLSFAMIIGCMSGLGSPNTAKAASVCNAKHNVESNFNFPTGFNEDGDEVYTGDTLIGVIPENNPFRDNITFGKGKHGWVDEGSRVRAGSYKINYTCEAGEEISEAYVIKNVGMKNAKGESIEERTEILNKSTGNVAHLLSCTTTVYKVYIKTNKETFERNFTVVPSTYESVKAGADDYTPVYKAVGSERVPVSNSITVDAGEDVYISAPAGQRIVAARAFVGFTNNASEADGNWVDIAGGGNGTTTGFYTGGGLWGSKIINKQGDIRIRVHKLDKQFLDENKVAYYKPYKLYIKVLFSSGGSYSNVGSQISDILPPEFKFSAVSGNLTYDTNDSRKVSGDAKLSISDKYSSGIKDYKVSIYKKNAFIGNTDSYKEGIQWDSRTGYGTRVDCDINFNLQYGEGSGAATITMKDGIILAEATDMYGVTRQADSKGNKSPLFIGIVDNSAPTVYYEDGNQVLNLGCLHGNAGNFEGTLPFTVQDLETGVKVLRVDGSTDPSTVSRNIYSMKFDYHKDLKAAFGKQQYEAYQIQFKKSGSHTIEVVDIMGNREVITLNLTASDAELQGVVDDRGDPGDIKIPDGSVDTWEDPIPTQTPRPTLKPTTPPSGGGSTGGSTEGNPTTPPSGGGDNPTATPDGGSGGGSGSNPTATPDGGSSGGDVSNPTPTPNGSGNASSPEAQGKHRVVIENADGSPNIIKIITTGSQNSPAELTKDEFKNVASGTEYRGSLTITKVSVMDKVTVDGVVVTDRPVVIGGSANGGSQGGSQGGSSGGSTGGNTGTQTPDPSGGSDGDQGGQGGSTGTQTPDPSGGSSDGQTGQGNVDKVGNHDIEIVHKDGTPNTLVSITTGKDGSNTDINASDLRDGKSYGGQLTINNIKEGDIVYVDGYKVDERPVVVGSLGGQGIDSKPTPKPLNPTSTPAPTPNGNQGGNGGNGSQGGSSGGNTSIDDIQNGGEYDGITITVGNGKTYIVDGKPITEDTIIKDPGQHTIEIHDGNNHYFYTVIIKDNKVQPTQAPPVVVYDITGATNGAIYRKAVTITMSHNYTLYKKTKAKGKFGAAMSKQAGTLVVKTNGVYKIVCGDKTITFTFDKSKPKLSVKKGKKYKKGKKVKVTDTLSGVKKVTMNGKKVKLKKGKFKLTKKGKVTICAWDKAGNKVTVKIKVK